MERSAPDPLDLDGRTFDMVSSTASRVDPDAPTRFRYAEADGVVWGDYTGDTVTVGRFAGVRTGNRLEVAFVHALVAGGRPVRGTAVSRVEAGRDGLLRLVEEFEVDGAPQTSVCAEVDPAPLTPQETSIRLMGHPDRPWTGVRASAHEDARRAGERG